MVLSLPKVVQTSDSKLVGQAKLAMADFKGYSGDLLLFKPVGKDIVSTTPVGKLYVTVELGQPVALSMTPGVAANAPVLVDPFGNPTPSAAPSAGILTKFGGSPPSSAVDVEVPPQLASARATASSQCDHDPAAAVPVVAATNGGAVPATSDPPAGLSSAGVSAVFPASPDAPTAAPTTAPTFVATPVVASSPVQGPTRPTCRSLHRGGGDKHVDRCRDL